MDANPERLCWRMESTESLSDWTIVVVVRDKLQGEVLQRYHVHKCILAAGFKKSEYFTRLFQSGGSFGESVTSTSRIELHEQAAQVFPAMLDYQYSSKDEATINTENATALYHLAEYFEAASLRSLIVQFITNTISIDNCGIYYEHAKVFHSDEIISLVIKTCREDLDCLICDSRIFQASDTSLWLRLGEGNINPYLSVLIANFCANHRNEVDADSFESLTKSSSLPSVACVAATSLMELEQVYLLVSPDAAELSGLQTRCVDALARSWKTVDVASTRKKLSQLSPLVMDSLWSGTIDNARNKVRLGGDSGREGRSGRGRGGLRVRGRF